MRSALGFSMRRSCRRSGWPGTAVDFDGFSGQSARDEDRLGRAVHDAIAAMAEPVDHKSLNHVRPR